MDYKSLGLKGGVEVHNQLNTRHKLFCSCSTKMSGQNPNMMVVRKQHPVASELGEYDIATKYEVSRDRTFVYECFPDETCIVETDEEPPHHLNREALDAAMTVAMILNCKIVDEVHVMRKTVIDGSNTTSFQRTMVIGTNGWMKLNGKKVSIGQVSLEEDASSIVGEENGTVRYRLNRLGVPLIEVSTGLLEGFTPEEMEQIAFQIGMTVRSTGKAKKVIGAIRQDLNVSIRGGARNEIKGIQELGMISKSVENEVDRQASIISIKEELKSKGVEKIHDDPVSVTHLFSGTENKIIRSVMENGGNIYAFALPGFSGMLRRDLFEGKTLGRELADTAVAFGLKGMMHTDEDVSKYGLVSEFEVVKAHLKARTHDAVVLIGDDKTHGKAAKEVLNRARSILIGVQEGTRSALPDGSTKYNRPLPGAKRMYPESDIVPMPITDSMVKLVRSNLPEPMEVRLSKLEKKHSLSHDLAQQIMNSDQSERLENIVSATKADSKSVANALVSVSKDIEKRGGVDSSVLEDSHFIDIFKSAAEGSIVKESIPDVMIFLAKNPKAAVRDAVKALGIKALSENEIREIVVQAVESAENPDKALGIAMSRLRGKVDARKVVDMVKSLSKK